MPNQTVPAAVTGLPAQPQPTRRIFLAAGSAAAVFASLGAAAAASAPSDDPVFAAIAERDRLEAMAA